MTICDAPSSNNNYNNNNSMIYYVFYSITSQQLFRFIGPQTVTC